MFAVSQHWKAGVVYRAEFLTITRPAPADKDDRSAPGRERLMDGCSGPDKLKRLVPEEKASWENQHTILKSLNEFLSSKLTSQWSVFSVTGIRFHYSITWVMYCDARFQKCDPEKQILRQWASKLDFYHWFHYDFNIWHVLIQSKWNISKLYFHMTSVASCTMIFCRKPHITTKMMSAGFSVRVTNK